MTDIKNRILEILRKEGIMPSRFADEIGVQRSAISHILSGRNKPGYDLIVKILKRFNKINAEWLILGEGEMYKNSEDFYSKNQKQIIINSSSKKNNEMDNLNNNNKNQNNRNFTPENTITKIKRIIIIYDDDTFSDHLNRNLHM